MLQAAQSGASPFAALSLIVAPAILTNACSILVLSTSNRLARAAHARSVLLLRALRSIYSALGGFSSAALIALLGVVFETRLPEPARAGIELLAVMSGAIGVGGIVWAAVLLLRETRIAVATFQRRFTAQQARFPAHDVS